ncbi:hypothetical protein [Dactylosporangium matsuzakiense]|uniref:Uncharacterized protein n=1 Tax=Dactylosporangium matsuzakiense TaxID=53360 RepID=A0A9W6NJ02_9ACTN|nr:hypothetical protein [Dactylosporangium matsuzakiense]UWZ47044.1 hypothetical protein Dmats_11960 [Dactylosporangium matsuzakiense]GLK98525.1 hypothetical protein GCM10017581_002660 [Dactylosporangium matsuzakiense]
MRTLFIAGVCTLLVGLAVTPAAAAPGPPEAGTPSNSWPAALQVVTDRW